MMDALNAIRIGRAQTLRPTAPRPSSAPVFSGTNHFVSHKPDTFQKRTLENKTLSFQGGSAAKPEAAPNPFQTTAVTAKTPAGKAVNLHNVSSAIHSGLSTAKNSMAALANQTQLGAVVKESPVRPVNPFMTAENMLFNPHANHMMQVTKSPSIIQQAAATLNRPNMGAAFRNLPLKMASGVSAVTAPLAAFTVLPLQPLFQPLAPMLTKLLSVVKMPVLVP